MTRLPFNLLNVEMEIGDAKSIIYLISERRTNIFFTYEDQTNLILSKYPVMCFCWLVSSTWLLFLLLLQLPGSWSYASTPKTESSRLYFPLHFFSFFFSTYKIRFCIPSRYNHTKISKIDDLAMSYSYPPSLCSPLIA